MDKARIDRSLKYLRLAKGCFLFVWTVILGMILIQFENIPLLMARTVFWFVMLVYCMRKMNRLKQSVMEGAQSKISQK